MDVCILPPRHDTRRYYFRKCMCIYISLYICVYIIRVLGTECGTAVGHGIHIQAFVCGITCVCAGTCFFFCDDGLAFSVVMSQCENSFFVA